MARILVIDDDKNIRTMVRLALLNAGHEVEVAEDGVEGLALFDEGSGWDLTLVDQRMPELEGRAVIPEIRRRDPAARVIMMTAFGTTELVAFVLSAGAADFLHKPFNADVLRGAVAAALDRPRQSLEIEAGSTPPSSTDATRPGAQGTVALTTPIVSYFLNGYRYWPLETGEPGEEETPSALLIHRAFRIRSPLGETRRCLVDVTPSVREQVRMEIGEEQAADDPIWDVVCQSTLTDHLWETMTMPPDILPVTEISPDLHETIRIMVERRHG